MIKQWLKRWCAWRLIARGEWQPSEWRRVPPPNVRCSRGGDYW